MLGSALGRARLEPDAVGGLGLVWTETRLAELAAAGLGADQAESVIDLVRTAAEAEVAMVCKQVADGGWTVSMRSKGRVDVSAAAVALGGGGHRFAAGFSSARRPRRHRGRGPAPRSPPRLQLPAMTGPGPGGLVVVDKPAGLTSHDVVARVRRLAGTRRVGHAGTLDPMATGVLVLGVERATRLLGHLTLTDKAYDGDDPARPGHGHRRRRGRGRSAVPRPPR